MEATRLAMLTQNSHLCGILLLLILRGSLGSPAIATFVQVPVLVAKLALRGRNNSHDRASYIAYFTSADVIKILRVSFGNS